jgi:hypothetical protein
MKDEKILKKVIKSIMIPCKPNKLSSLSHLYLYSKTSKCFDNQWNHYLDEFEKWLIIFPYTNTYTLNLVFDAWYNKSFKNSNINGDNIWSLIKND